MSNLCTGTAKARIDLAYYRNQNDPRVYHVYSRWIGTGHTTASLPGGVIFKGMKGEQKIF